MGVYKPTEKGIVSIAAKNPAALRDELVSLGPSVGIRVVILDCTGEMEAVPFGEGLCRLIAEFPVPVVAAFAGEIKGWGMAVACGAHICFAEDESVLVLESERIASEAPKPLEMVSAALARRKGSINHNVPQQNALESAVATAEKISSMAPLAVRACLKSMNQLEKTGIDKGLAIESALFSQLFESQDMRRGTSAFLEKRKPVFEGN